MIYKPVQVEILKENGLFRCAVTMCVEVSGCISKIYLFMIALCFPLLGFSYEGERAQEIGQSYVDCAAFYTIVTWRLRQDGNTFDAATAADRHLEAISLGRIIFTADEYDSKFDLALSAMVIELDDGIYKLSAKYDVLCEDLLKMQIDRVLFKRDVASIRDVDTLIY